jgi:hypothetical protein
MDGWITNYEFDPENTRVIIMIPVWDISRDLKEERVREFELPIGNPLKGGIMNTYYAKEKYFRLP